jgi:hypothetical protein
MGCFGVNVLYISMEVFMKKVLIGSVGLGRLDLRHAENIAGKIQNAELVARYDVDKTLLKTASPQ